LRQHRVDRLPVAVGVGVRTVVPLCDRLAREEGREHRADAVGDGLDSGLARRRGETFTETTPGLFESFVDGAVAQTTQRRKPRRHRERVAGERARLIDRPRWRYLLHDVASASVCADGKAAADYLAERRQVWSHAVKLLRAAARESEARHHFVEDEQR